MTEDSSGEGGPTAAEMRARRRGELGRRRRRLERWLEEMDLDPVVEVDPSSEPGVSVIVPSYAGREHLAACIESLVAQTLDHSLFEIVVVLNGPPDGSREVLEQMQERHPEIVWRVVELLDSPGVGRARNAGIDVATRRFVAFVDDDDEVSPNYLAALYAHAETDVVPMAWLDDVSTDGVVDEQTPVNKVLEQVEGTTLSPGEVPSLLSLNACKLLPATLVRRVGYDTELRSGVDVEFLTQLYAAGRFRVHVLLREEGAVYRRTVRPGSVSRQAYDFGFSVEGRLDVIQRISPHAVSSRTDVRLVTRAMIGAQTGFMTRYLQTWPEERARVVEAVHARALPWFAWDVLNRDQGHRLAVSYCFVPYAGTSSIVAAKRIRQSDTIVDVIYNAMSSVREVDQGTRVIAGSLIDREISLATPTLFGIWRAVEEFCAAGWAAVVQAEEAKGAYSSVWSRAMWPASHALAALHVIRRPDAPWVAEFSDPLSRNVRGERREGAIGDGPIAQELVGGLAVAGYAVPDGATLFELCEQLAYVFATELHFTNTNQLEFMLDYCPPQLRETVRSKARLMPQPTLPAAFYSMADVTDHSLPADRVNIGYFGAFYVNRGIGEVVEALERLDEKERGALQLHVFTSDPEALAASLAGRPAAAHITVAGYRPYLEFLALAARMDALLVNDAVTSGTGHDVNPYLPSKYSDYKGSGAPIWGHVEPGSPLSQESLAYVSRVGEIDSVVDVLRAVLAQSVVSA